MLYPLNDGQKIWCGWSESNRQDFRRGILNPLCLPLSPHPQNISVGPLGVEPSTYRLSEELASASS